MAAAEAIAYLRANIDDFSAKMGEAKAEMDDVGKSGSSGLSKLSTIGKYALLGVAAAAAGVAVASIDMADKYQAATDQLAANAGISVNAADKIGKAFLGTAGTTIYSAQQIMTAYSGVAGQLGSVQGHALNSAQAMTVMRAAMDLAEATGGNLTSTTSDLAGIMQAYGIKASGAAAASNVLFNAARLTGNSVDSLASSIERMHTKLGVASPSLKDTGALMVELAEHGETGRAALSAVGTAMQTLIKSSTGVATAQLNLHNALSQLPPDLQGLAQQYQNGTLTGEGLTNATNAMSASQTEVWSAFTSASSALQKAQNSYQSLGISVVNAQGKFVGMGSVIDQLGPKLKGMTQAQQLATLSQLFGASAAQKLLTVIQAGPAAFDKAAAAVARSNSVHRAAEEQAKTLQHQMEQVKATVEDYGVKIGQALIPKLQDLLSAGLAVSAFLLKHKEILYAVATVIGTVLVAAIGVYIAGLISSAATTVATFATMTASAVTWAASTAASVAETAAIWALYAAENIAKVAVIVATNVAGAAVTAAAWIAANIAMIAATGGIILAIGALVIAVVEIVKHWKTIEDFFKRLWGDVKKIFDDALHDIEDIVKRWWPVLLGIFTGGLGLIIGEIIQHWATVKSDTVAAWNDIVNFFTSIPKKILAALSTLGKLLLSWIDDVWDTFTAYVKAAWQAEIAFWTTIPAKILSAISSFLGLLINWITTVWNTFYNYVVSQWNTMVAFWTTIPAKVINAVASFGGMLVGWIESAFAYLLSAVESGIGAVVSFFGSLPGKVLGVLGDAGSWLLNVGRQILDGLIQGLENGEQDVLNKIKSIGSDISGAFKSVLSIASPSLVFASHGNFIMEGLAQGIQQGYSSKVAPLMSGIAGQISGTNFGATGSFNAGIPSLANAAAASGGSSQPINLNIDGQTFARLILPSLQSVGSQYQRTIPVPIFGNLQS